MTKIRVITDSDSSLSPEIARKYEIDLVPITIQFGTESFMTNETIDDKMLFARIAQQKKLPTTAAPSPAAFVTTFKKAFDAGYDEILCVCVSSRVSSTYESALIAANEFPGKKIRIVDSLYMSMGLGFQAIAASEAVSKGASLEDAAKLAESMIPNLCTFASFATLDYLVMGGRVGKFAAGMAGALDIRPILTMKDGTLQMLEKVRTRKGAMDRLVNVITKSIGTKKVYRAGLFHADNLEDAKLLQSRLSEQFQLPDEVFVVEFTPGLSVHSGPGMVGGVFYSL